MLWELGKIFTSFDSFANIFPKLTKFSIFNPSWQINQNKSVSHNQPRTYRHVFSSTISFHYPFHQFQGLFSPKILFLSWTRPDSAILFSRAIKLQWRKREKGEKEGKAAFARLFEAPVGVRSAIRRASERSRRQGRRERERVVAPDPGQAERRTKEKRISIGDTATSRPNDGLPGGSGWSVHFR